MENDSSNNNEPNLTETNKPSLFSNINFNKYKLINAIQFALILAVILGLGLGYLISRNSSSNNDKLTDFEKEHLYKPIPTNTSTPTIKPTPTDILVQGELRISASCPTKYLFFENEYFSICVPERFKFVKDKRFDATFHDDETTINASEVIFDSPNDEISISTDLWWDEIGSPPSCQYGEHKSFKINNSSASRQSKKEVLDAEKNLCADFWWFLTDVNDSDNIDEGFPYGITMNSKGGKGIYKNTLEIETIEKTLKIKKT